MRCRRFRIYGRVQGVRFRASAREEANRLAITGYAENCDDGSVEVLACGDGAALDQFAHWLQEGSPRATVSRVDAAESDCDGASGFDVR